MRSITLVITPDPIFPLVDEVNDVIEEELSAQGRAKTKLVSHPLCPHISDGCLTGKYILSMVFKDKGE